MVMENLVMKVHLDLNIDFDDQELSVEENRLDSLGNFLMKMLIDWVMLLMNLDYREMDTQQENSMDSQAMVEIDGNNWHQDPKERFDIHKNSSFFILPIEDHRAMDSLNQWLMKHQLLNRLIEKQVSK